MGVVPELIREDVLVWSPLIASALLGSVPAAMISSFFVEHHGAGLTGVVKG